jgi:hypothetical protein
VTALSLSIVPAKELVQYFIAENLHRADLTQLQRTEQIALWIKLTDEKNNSGRTAATIPRGPGMPEGGLRAAAREIGVKRTSAQEAVKVAALSLGDDFGFDLFGSDIIFRRQLAKLCLCLEISHIVRVISALHGLVAEID